MFFKRRDQMEISQGDRFERPLAGYLIERAEVVWIGEDSYGIPHVRVNVSLRTPSREEPQGTRMLARTAFAAQFRLSHS